jgi:hypothetical protein
MMMEPLHLNVLHLSHLAFWPFHASFISRSIIILARNNFECGAATTRSTQMAKEQTRGGTRFSAHQEIHDPTIQATN